MAFNAAKLRDAGEKPEWGEPPIGSHIAALADSKAFTSSKGNDVCKVRFQIQGGAHNGHEWDVIMTLEESSAGLGITYRQLKAIGINLSNIDSLFELDDEMRKHHGRVYQVDVEQSGQWINTWVKSEQTQTALNVNGGDGMSDAPIDTAGLLEPAAAVAEDDLPF
jgi:hypothetical protein